MGLPQTILLLLLSPALLAVLAISPASLDIQYDHGLANDIKKLVYGSIVTIPGLSTWPDGKALDLAFEAYQGMVDKHKNGRPPGGNFKDQPNAVTVLFTGDTAIISSSTKGPGSLLYEGFIDGTNEATVTPPTGKRPNWGTLKTGVCPDVILDGLKKCEKTTPIQETMGHQNGGACGEVMAALALCSEPGPWPQKDVRIVAVALNNKAKRVTVKEPCGFDESESQWNPKGCAQFNEHFNWRQIPPNTQREDCGQPANMQVRHAGARITITPAAASSSTTGGASKPAKDSGGKSAQKKPSKNPRRTFDEALSADEDSDDEPYFEMRFLA